MAPHPARTSARGDAALTIIAPGTRVVGEIESTGVVKVEGTVTGTVKAERQVLIAREGTVDGDILGTEVIVGGRVEGAVTATDRVEVQTGAVIHGDVTAKRLVVQEGGEVNGIVKMGAQSASAEPAPA